MRISRSLAMAALASAFALPALAEGLAHYPYKTHKHYCPAGYKPVVVEALISCGKPNTQTTWQQAVRHPVVRVSSAAEEETASAVCKEGEKGCK